MTSLEKANQRINSYKEWSHFLSLANLGLTYKDLKEILPRLLQLKKLKKLDLSNNNISYLPNNIGNFTELTFLNLSNNTISYLPDNLRKLTNPEIYNNLSVLNLTNNNLKELPEGLRKDMLSKELILDNNDNLIVSRIKKGLHTLGTQLISIFNSTITGTFNFVPTVRLITEREITLPINIKNQVGLITERVMSLLFNLESPVKLILSNISSELKAYLKKGTYDIKIEEKISSSSKKEHVYIDLSDTCLTNEKLEQLIPCLANLTKPIHLKLCSNNLTKLPEDIGSIKNLQILNLENNDFIELPSSIRKLENLLELNLSNNDRIILPYCLEEYLTNLRVLILDESISLRNLLILMRMKKIDPKKIESNENPIAVHGLSKRLINEFGKFHEFLRGDLMKIAEIVAGNNPKMKTEEFFMFFDSLTDNQKKGVIDKSVSLSRLSICNEETDIFLLNGLTVPFKPKVSTTKTPNHQYHNNKSDLQSKPAPNL